MITRFRVEAKSSTKEEVENELNALVTEIQNRLHHSVWGQDRDKWGCTDYVISLCKDGYEGRMVFVYYRGEQNGE